MARARRVVGLELPVRGPAFTGLGRLADFRAAKCLKVELQAGGDWIFVFHAHRDLEKVRRIRNELERRGHNPLLFFLKCLEADDARLPELICD